MFAPIPWRKRELEQFKAKDTEPPQQQLMTFQDVIRNLCEIDFPSDADSILKNRWVSQFRNDLISWYRYTLHGVWQHRHQPSNLMTVMNITEGD